MRLSPASKNFCRGTLGLRAGFVSGALNPRVAQHDMCTMLAKQLTSSDLHCWLCGTLDHAIPPRAC